MKIEKKVWPQYFQAIKDGKKRFELRLADFKADEGDVIVLREWDPKTSNYTGRTLEKEITYIIKTKDISFWSDEEVKKHGYQILSLK